MIFAFKRHPASDVDLSAFVDGELPGARLAAVQAHVSSCQACQTRVEELRTVRDAVRVLTPVRPPRSVTLTESQTARSRAPARRGYLALAPALALTLFVILLGVDLGGVVSGGATTRAPAGQPAAYGSLAQQDKAAAPSQQAAPTPARPAAGLAPVFSSSAESQANQPATASPAPAVAAAPPAPAATPPGSSALQKSPSTSGGSGKTWIHVLEGLAALAFVGSAGYAFVRWRSLP